MLDWECAAREDIDHMAEYIKTLQKMLLLAEGEREQLLQENKEITTSHSKDINQITKTRARTRWATARKQTQVDEKLKKIKVSDSFVQGTCMFGRRFHTLRSFINCVCLLCINLWTMLLITKEAMCLARQQEIA